MKRNFNYSFYVTSVLIFVALLMAAFLNTNNGCNICIFPALIVGLLLFIIGPFAAFSFAKLILHATRTKNILRVLGNAIAVIGSIIIAGISTAIALILLLLTGIT